MLNYKEIAPAELDKIREIIEEDGFSALTEAQKIAYLSTGPSWYGIEWKEMDDSQKIIWCDAQGSMDDVVWDCVEDLASCGTLPESLEWLEDACKYFQQTDEDDMAEALEAHILANRLRGFTSPLTLLGKEAAASLADDVESYCNSLESVAKKAISMADDSADWIPAARAWLEEQ